MDHGRCPSGIRCASSKAAGKTSVVDLGRPLWTDFRVVVGIYFHSVGVYRLEAVLKPNKGGPCVLISHRGCVWLVASFGLNFRVARHPGIGLAVCLLSPDYVFPVAIALPEPHKIGKVAPVTRPRVPAARSLRSVFRVLG